MSGMIQHKWHFNPNMDNETRGPTRVGFVCDDCKEQMTLSQAEAILSGWEAAKAREEAQFPMQDGPSIPWSLAERIYSVYSDLFGTRQSLRRLAERGGFGWSEIPFLRKDYLRKHGRLPEWLAASEPPGEPSETGGSPVTPGA